MANMNPGDPNDRTNYPSENPNIQPNQESYGSGYVHGQTIERQRYEAAQQARDENNSATGFLIGIFLAALVLGGAALAYFVTQRNQTQTPAQRTIILPSASPSPQVKERVIERDRVVPVPQPQQSSPTVIPAPNVTIEAPKPAPAQTEPSTPSSSSSSRSQSSSTEQPKSAEPSPSPDASANPNSTNSSGQPSGSGQ